MTRRRQRPGPRRTGEAMTTIDDLPRGLEGVVVSATSIGDVRGSEGFFHYRQYSAVDLAHSRDLTDVVALLVDGALPTDALARDTIAAELHAARVAPPDLLALLPAI